MVSSGWTEETSKPHRKWVAHTSKSFYNTCLFCSVQLIFFLPSVACFNGEATFFTLELPVPDLFIKVDINVNFNTFLYEAAFHWGMTIMFA